MHVQCLSSMGTIIPWDSSKADDAPSLSMKAFATSGVGVRDATAMGMSASLSVFSTAMLSGYSRGVSLVDCVSHLMGSHILTVCLRHADIKVVQVYQGGAASERQFSFSFKGEV